jgi:hypothetical protein
MSAGRGAEGGASGESGTGGTGGMPVEGDGFICQSPERCDSGERCTPCTTSNGMLLVCVPNPEEDPAGFAAATEDCASGVGEHFSECDGPEDCPSDRYCVWGNDQQAAYGGPCLTEDELPQPQQATCCFTCGALPLCVTCRTDADCPDTLECVPFVGAPSGVNGCRAGA